MKIKELINRVIQFLKEVYYELRKVTWLSRKEMVASTVVVVALVVVIALFVGFLDFLLTKVLSFIL